jgi:hypothetical protein
MKELGTPKCGNKECSASTGICESVTFGSGKLDFYGYWEKPCAICAREFEKLYPEYSPCWPFEGELKEILQNLTNENQNDIDFLENHLKGFMND